MLVKEQRKLWFFNTFRPGNESGWESVSEQTRHGRFSMLCCTEVERLLRSGQTVRNLFSQMEGSAEAEGEGAQDVFEFRGRGASLNKDPEPLPRNDDTLSQSLANLDNVLQAPQLAQLSNIMLCLACLKLSQLELGWIGQNLWKSELIVQGFASDVAHLVSLRSRSLVSVTLHIVLAVFAKYGVIVFEIFWDVFLPLVVWLQEVLSTCYRVNTFCGCLYWWIFCHCLSVSHGERHQEPKTCFTLAVILVFWYVARIRLWSSWLAAQSCGCHRCLVYSGAWRRRRWVKAIYRGLFSVTGCAGCTFGFDACSFLITDEQTHLIVHRWGGSWLQMWNNWTAKSAMERGSRKQIQIQVNTRNTIRNKWK